jgi:hypothetical protein
MFCPNTPANRLIIVIICINFFSNHDFSIQFLQVSSSLIKREGPEPKFVISAPAPGGNLISAPRHIHFCDQCPINLL